MYELIILSLLMYSPLHGYLIAKITNDMIGPYAKVSNGTLYPLLARLEKEDLIAVSDRGNERHGDRQTRSFVITEAGRKHFHRLMMDTTSNPGEYQKFFRFKVPYMELLQPDERLYLYDHYINYCQTHVLYMKTQAKELLEETAGQYYMPARRLEGTLDVLNQFANEWQMELDWAKQLREKEVAHIQAAENKHTQETGINP